MSRRTVNISLHLILIVLTYAPFYFMLVSSVKTNPQILNNYFAPVFPFHLNNYVHAFDRVIDYLLNSVVICGVSVAGVIVISSLSSYVFAKVQFPGKNMLFLLLLSFLMIPSVLTLIPSFVLVVDLGLINSYWAAILPYMAFGQIIVIFVLRTFIEQIPQDLFDSAKMDGASHVTIFLRIVISLSKPIITSMALLNVLNNWNDFIWPMLVLPSESMKPVSVGLYAMTGVQQVEYGPLFAGFAIASVPMILLLAVNMNYFIKGVTSGAVKA
ncbi:carbohydrate ABC transporter permease [Cohnella sp. GCM10020058]|uniref:carbohydrate ABC transporter permease n=1 Tax=Cohnella sp. GCM10020058 TaxID=3317330 RepID=UPI003638F13D